MTKVYFQQIEEAPDSAFFITPEIEKKLESFKVVDGALVDAVEHGKQFQKQNAWKQPKHAHYFKDVSKLQTIDVYRVLQLFEVSDPCIQHAIKKLLVAGGRGAKDKPKDIQEAIDTLKRWQIMQEENLK